MIENQLICATQGWEDPHWLESYFPDECPEDWRFAFYSNDFRGLWVPVSFWESPEALLTQFEEDSDEDFYFIFELPQDWLSETTRLIKTLSAVRLQIACLVLPIVDVVSAQEIKIAAEPLAKHFPLALSLPDNHPTQQEIVALSIDMDCSIVWPAESGKPYDSGQFLPVVTSEQNLRQLRSVIETIGAWLTGNGEQEAHRNAGLFYRPHKTAPSDAMKARELAELLGVA